MSVNTPKGSKGEIDLLFLAKTIWKKRKQVTGIVTAFIVLGLIVAVLRPKEFTATSTFVPQTSDSGKSSGSIGGLASLAGINISGLSGGADISPSLYPKIVSSVTFRKALLEATIHVEGAQQAISYKQYYDEFYSPGFFGFFKKYILGLPNFLINAIRGASPKMFLPEDTELHILSDDDFEHFKRLESQFLVTPNEKGGFVSLSFSMPEPLMAAEMAKFAEELLQKEIIQFKIQNAKEQLRFTEERFFEKKKEFEEAQTRLANFRDRNQNIASATFLNQLQKLEADYNFTLNIYNELAKQLEQAKLQVAKDTPLLSVIQPVTIPTEKSSPNRPIILVVFAVLGLFFAILYVFGIELLNKIKLRWNEI